MTAHPPAAHVSPPASAPSASTPALPVDESDELSGTDGSSDARPGEGILERIEWTDVVRIVLVGAGGTGRLDRERGRHTRLGRGRRGGRGHVGSGWVSRHTGTPRKGDGKDSAERAGEHHPGIYRPFMRLDSV